MNKIAEYRDMICKVAYNLMENSGSSAKNQRNSAGLAGLKQQLEAEESEAGRTLSPEAEKAVKMVNTVNAVRAAKAEPVAEEVAKAAPQVAKKMSALRKYGPVAGGVLAAAGLGAAGYAMGRRHRQEKTAIEGYKDQIYKLADDSNDEWWKNDDVFNGTISALATQHSPASNKLRKMIADDADAFVAHHPDTTAAKEDISFNRDRSRIKSPVAGRNAAIAGLGTAGVGAGLGALLAGKGSRGMGAAAGTALSIMPAALAALIANHRTNEKERTSQVGPERNDKRYKILMDMQNHINDTYSDDDDTYGRRFGFSSQRPAEKTAAFKPEKPDSWFSDTKERVMKHDNPLFFQGPAKGESEQHYEDRKDAIIKGTAVSKKRKRNILEGVASPLIAGGGVTLAALGHNIDGSSPHSAYTKANEAYDKAYNAVREAAGSHEESRAAASKAYEAILEASKNRVGGKALMGAGALVGLAGLGLGGHALISSIREGKKRESYINAMTPDEREKYDKIVRDRARSTRWGNQMRF